MFIFPSVGNHFRVMIVCMDRIFVEFGMYFAKVRFFDEF